MRTSRSLLAVCVRLANLALADDGLDRDEHDEAVRRLAEHLHGVILIWVAERLLGRLPR
jgi:hypothetical protein